MSELEFLDPVRPGYAGRSRRLGQSSIRLPSPNMAVCPVCGKQARSESFIRSRDGVSTSVTQIQCVTYRRKKERGRNAGWRAEGCPITTIEEPLAAREETTMPSKGQSLINHEDEQAILSWLERTGIPKYRLSVEVGRSKTWLSGLLYKKNTTTGEELDRIRQAMVRMEQELENASGGDQQLVKKSLVSVATAWSKPEETTPAAETPPTLTELLGQGPDLQQQLDRVDRKIESLSEAFDSLAVMVSDRIRQFQQQIGQLPEQPDDIYDRFRQFEEAARQALESDAHLFMAVVRRVMGS